MTCKELLLKCVQCNNTISALHTRVVLRTLLHHNYGSSVCRRWFTNSFRKPRKSVHIVQCEKRKCKSFEVLLLQPYIYNFQHLICRNVANIPPSRKQKMPSGSPITWTTVGLAVAVGSILILAWKAYVNRKEEELDSETIRSYGKPHLGGDFELLNQDGVLVSNRSFIGNWVLLYFGFTHCPDICPEELEKMALVIDTVNRNEFTSKLQPVFISIDPERDTPEAVKTYIADFHPNMIGLTGSREQVDAASRAFRVYYSAGPKDEESDYLVDHTVIMYLLDDKGEFCEYFGQNKSAGEIASSITATMFKRMKTKK